MQVRRERIVAPEQAAWEKANHNSSPSALNLITSALGYGIGDLSTLRPTVWSIEESLRVPRL